MSLFDPQQLADVETSESMETKNEPLPIGTYKFTIEGAPEIRRIDPQDSSKDAFYVFELKCYVPGSATTPDGSTVEAVTGKEKAYARYKGFLDIDPQTGAYMLGKGKNVDLGRIREATGNNQPGQPFKLGMLAGCTFEGECVHVADRRDSSKVYAEVKNARPAN